MKKNTMMRLASFLLVAVLISTSAISGTYAKYVTADSGMDNARVAKWGVTATVEGSLFEPAYKDAPTTYTAKEAMDTITVQSSDKADVVAPGTKNETGMTFVLTGTPEVDTKVDIVVTASGDVKLPAGTYSDYTTGDADDTFKLDEDYYPVVFTLSNGAGKTLKSGKLTEIATYLNGLSKTYHTNKNLAEIATDTDGTYKLTWEWDFDANGTGVNDKADTYLGNVAAGLVANGNAVTAISFDISITVTQID